MNDSSQPSDDSWCLGQKVILTQGPFQSYIGEIYLIDRKERIVRVHISIFGRLTSFEASFDIMKSYFSPSNE
jgi:transcription antitermination factor NusG